MEAFLFPSFQIRKVKVKILDLSSSSLSPVTDLCGPSAPDFAPSVSLRRIRTTPLAVPFVVLFLFSLGFTEIVGSIFFKDVHSLGIVFFKDVTLLFSYTFSTVTVGLGKKPPFPKR